MTIDEKLIIAEDTIKALEKECVKLTDQRDHYKEQRNYLAKSLLPEANADIAINIFNSIDEGLL